MPIMTMQEMFTHELGDIYDAEQQFLKGQAEMAKNATDPTLKAGIEKHMAESETHVKNIEQVFKLVGKTPYVALGAPGGSRIITSVAQAIVNVLDFDMGMDAAVQAPRFHSEEEQLLFLEPAFSDAVVAALDTRGNDVRRSNYMSRV